MSGISIQREHDLDVGEARTQIERLAMKLVDRVGGSWRWDEDAVVCEFRGAIARVGYDARYIKIDVELPRALQRFQQSLEAKIEETFERHFRH